VLKEPFGVSNVRLVDGSRDSEPVYPVLNVTRVSMKAAATDLENHDTELYLVLGNA